MSAQYRRVCGAGALLILVVAVGVVVAWHGGPILADRVVSDWIAAHRVDTSMVSGFSEIFGPVLVSVWTAVVAVIFAVRDRALARAVSVMCAVAGAGACAEAVKLIVARPRPPMSLHPGIAEMTYSYPSGHVTGTSALVISTALVATAASRPVIRRWSYVLAAMIVVVAAGTRLYLGVHWFSDVVAGCAVGAAAAIVMPGVVAGVVHRYAYRLPHGPVDDHRPVRVVR